MKEHLNGNKQGKAFLTYLKEKNCMTNKQVTPASKNGIIDIDETALLCCPIYKVSWSSEMCRLQSWVLTVIPYRN